MGAAEDVGTRAGHVAEGLAERLQPEQLGAREGGGAVHALLHAMLLPEAQAGERRRPARRCPRASQLAAARGMLHEWLDERVRRRLEPLTEAGRRQRGPLPLVEHVLYLQLDVVLHLRVEWLLFLLMLVPVHRSGHRPLRLRLLALAAPAANAALQ